MIFDFAVIGGGAAGLSVSVNSRTHQAEIL